MAHHYNSPCSQCYKFKDCKKIEEREFYRKKWVEEGCPIGMSNHDCFKSPEEYDRDLSNAKISQETEDIERCIKRMSQYRDYAVSLGMDNVMKDDFDKAIKALKIVSKIPKVERNLKNMQKAWEDPSFKNRSYAEAHIKSLRTALEQIYQLEEIWGM